MSQFSPDHFNQHVRPGNENRLYTTPEGEQSQLRHARPTELIAVGILGDEALKGGMRFQAVHMLSESYPGVRARIIQYRGTTGGENVDIFLAPEDGGRVAMELARLGKPVTVGNSCPVPASIFFPGASRSEQVLCVLVQMDGPLTGNMAFAIDHALKLPPPEILAITAEGERPPASSIPPGLEVRTLREQLQRDRHRIKELCSGLEGQAILVDALNEVGLAIADRRAFLDAVWAMNMHEQALILGYRKVSQGNVQDFVRAIVARDPGFIAAVNRMGGFEGRNTVVPSRSAGN